MFLYLIDILSRPDTELSNKERATLVKFLQGRGCKAVDVGAMTEERHDVGVLPINAFQLLIGPSRHESLDFCSYIPITLGIPAHPALDVVDDGKAIFLLWELESIGAV